ncbi:hypothetical protein Ancab_017205, partial [Ancistrocladus abbreviatus]
ATLASKLLSGTVHTSATCTTSACASAGGGNTGTAGGAGVAAAVLAARACPVRHPLRGARVPRRHRAPACHTTRARRWATTSVVADGHLSASCIRHLLFLCSGAHFPSNLSLFCFPPTCTVLSLYSRRVKTMVQEHHLGMPGGIGWSTGVKILVPRVTRGSDVPVSKRTW